MVSLGGSGLVCLTHSVLVWPPPVKKKARPSGQTFFLVDPTRENWNCIFAGLQVLSERLKELGVDALRGGEDVLD